MSYRISVVKAKDLQNYIVLLAHEIDIFVWLQNIKIKEYSILLKI